MGYSRGRRESLSQLDHRQGVYYQGPNEKFSPLIEFYGEKGQYFVLTGPLHVLIALGMNPVLGIVDAVVTLGYTVRGPLIYFTSK